MKIVSMHEAVTEPFIHSVFTGSDVTRQELAPSSGEFEVTMVNFGSGVRNKAHAHDSEQILIVIDGEGIVATEEEEHTVAPGDVVYIPPGEVHWHGATPNGEFSHIFVMKRNSVLNQVEE